MLLADFINQPFLQKMRMEKRWTVSNSSKMPLDFNALINLNKIRGAFFHDGNEPLVTLDTILKYLPNVTNVAYSLNQALDNIVLLDIEPECPNDLKEHLLHMPAVYRETSMSGKGVHLVLPAPMNTEYENIRLSKPAIKDKSRYFEILLNHYVTFTGNYLPAPEGQLLSWDDFTKLFNELAGQAPSTKYMDCELSDFPNLEDIPDQAHILSILGDFRYKKKPKDFADKDHPKGDVSCYEFGMAGFYGNRLKNILAGPRYEEHEYTLEEKMVLLHSILKDKLPYREKHDTMRDGLPWLMFTCRRILTAVPKS